MLITRLKALTAALLAVTLLGGSGALLTSRTLGEEPGQGKSAASPRPASNQDAKARPEEDAK